MTAGQLLSLIALGAIALLCLRFPHTVARILASNVRPDVKPVTKSQDLARLIRQGSPEWKTQYPEFYGFIRGIGYVAVAFFVLLVLGVTVSYVIGLLGRD